MCLLFAACLLKIMAEEEMNLEENIMKIIDQEVPHHSNVDDTTKTLPFSDIGLDSLDLMTVMLAIGEELGVHIPDEEIPTLTSFFDLVEYVRRKKQ